MTSNNKQKNGRPTLSAAELLASVPTIPSDVAESVARFGGDTTASEELRCDAAIRSATLAIRKRSGEMQGFMLAELAERVGNSPADVLDILADIGPQGFWLQGNRFRDAGELQAAMTDWDSVGEVEVNLDLDEQERFCLATGIELEQLGC